MRDLTPEEVYEGMANIRRPVMRALYSAISNIFDRYLNGSQGILEVGAGDGFLKRTLKSKLYWVELDKYESRPRDCFVQSSATSMPFQNDEFDAVVGFESYNTFSASELEKALIESIRVLKSGGNFLLAYDFFPSASIFYTICAEKGLMVQEVECMRDGLLAGGIKYIPLEKMADYKAAVNSKTLGSEERGSGLSEIDRSFQEIFAMLFSNDAWDRYGVVMTGMKMAEIFQEYVCGIISPHFDDIEHGVEIQFYSGTKLNGQEVCNIRPDFIDINAPPPHILEDFNRWNEKSQSDSSLCMELIGVPFIVGKGKVKMKVPAE